jgi:hypothetical protein
VAAGSAVHTGGVGGGGGGGLAGGQGRNCAWPAERGAGAACPSSSVCLRSSPSSLAALAVEKDILRRQAAIESAPAEDVRRIVERLAA